MELPITRPSIMSYADQLDFNELLGKLKSDKCNGFIRVTSGNLEGHILFKEGNQVAASFDNESKVEAIVKIRSVTADASTVIEVFDLKETQLDYLMNVNKAYLINQESKAENIRQEIEFSPPEPKTEPKVIKTEPEIGPSEDTEPNRSIKDVIDEVKSAKETKTNIPEETVPSETESPLKTDEIQKTPQIDSSKDQAEKEPLKTPVVNDENIEKPLIQEQNEDMPLIKEDPQIKVSEGDEAEETPLSEDIEFKEPGAEAESMDRSEIMKKYGLKDVHEEEVENLLESYKGGSLSAEDVEKVELTLMNKIKKSILGIPKIKGAEVIVFLDNSSELLGTINIITEYESKGFLSRIMGDSKDNENLRTQIINLTEIEIRKSFRGYPEIVNNFEINVEFS